MRPASFHRRVDGRVEHVRKRRRADARVIGGTGRFAGVTGLLHASNALTPFQSPASESPFVVETIETVTTGYISY